MDPEKRISVDDALTDVDLWYDSSELVVDKDDLRKLTARQRDITTDGLIRIPTAFRSAFKNFVLHIAGQQQGSEYSVKIDAILSSVVKESRRNYPGRRGV
ncbi:hypothetical protein ANCCAN_06265 [Ancylostoma caninum]|uniref:Uncharacterized protein n=1 Tax=Ancylostoma caninum TaxID=29170 RepID=A0A368GXF8_ANCCA|nr:hypothetical protein ANCCAN_06265 [Ancylostoma caninum]